jgi:hypothetical protein
MGSEVNHLNGDAAELLVGSTDLSSPGVAVVAT